MASNLIETHPPHSGEVDTQLLHCIACQSRTGVRSLVMFAVSMCCAAVHKNG